MIRVLVMLAAIAVAVDAAAVDVAGVKLPATTTLGGREVVLNGAGVRTKVVFKIYVGSLWLPQKAADLTGVLAQSPRRIRMDLLRDLSADQLADALLEGLKDNLSEAELATVKSETGQLVVAMKGFGDVKQGSVVTLDYIDGATHVTLDAKERATIAGEAFNKALTRIWLGAHPVQASLQKDMLGGGGA
jgi:long-chain acyl-CoA synthetase